MALPIARDLMNDGVRVNTILPGIFKTPMMAMMPHQVQEALGAQVPFPKRMGTAEEYAKLACIIAEKSSPGATFLSIDAALIPDWVPALASVADPPGSCWLQAASASEEANSSRIERRMRDSPDMWRSWCDSAHGLASLWVATNSCSTNGGRATFRCPNRPGQGYRDRHLKIISRKGKQLP